MIQKKLLTSDQAVTVARQPHSPCSDCPWARESLKGWLGGSTVGQWLAEAHSDNVIACHTRNCEPTGAPCQCAGAAIFRSNVIKFPTPPNLDLPEDTKKVFASDAEFASHHLARKVTPKQASQMKFDALMQAMNRAPEPEELPELQPVAHGEEPTPERIRSEISRLRALRPHVRRFTIFQDDNWEAINAQIEVLRGTKNYDFVEESDVEAKFGGSDYILTSAMEAYRWAMGSEDYQGEGSPSKEWEALAK